MTKDELDKVIKLLNLKASTIKNAINQGWSDQFLQVHKNELFAQLYFAEQLTGKVISLNETTWRAEYDGKE